MELKTLQAEIEHILRTYPETRDSDEKLYANYLARHGITVVSVAQFFNNFPKYHVSNFKSVERARRKIVETNPDLAPSERIQLLRDGLQETFLEYSRT